MATDGRGRLLTEGSIVLAPIPGETSGRESATVIKAGETSSRVRYYDGEERDCPNNQISVAN